jgi:hypothetical protein
MLNGMFIVIVLLLGGKGRAGEDQQKQSGGKNLFH